MAGMGVSAASAAVASFSGLRGLAEAAGWAPSLAWLLPVTVDAYATTSARVWLAASTPTNRARGFARANALGAICASITGNAVYHALGAGLMAVTWPIIVAVGAVPAAVLGLTAHLHALRTHTEPSGTGSVPNRPGPVGDPTRAPAGTGPRHRAAPDEDTPKPAPWPPRPTLTAPEARPPAPAKTDAPGRARYGPDADLWEAARRADHEYRREHGRPITRDALRSALRIGASRATELRRRLAAEPADPARPIPADEPGPAAPSPVPDRKENPTTDDAQH